MAWLNGVFTKAALSSTILVAGLAVDKNTAGKLPKYPDMPKYEEQRGNREYTQAEIAAQNKRLEIYMNSLMAAHNGR